MPAHAEIVRDIIGALNRGDVDGLLALTDPDFEWRTLDDSPAAGTYRGHDQVRDYVDDWLRTFDQVRIDVGTLEEHGDRILAEVASHGRGKLSGIELNNPFCQLWTVRDGLALRMRELPDRESALAELG